jgi:hypothetical protein
MANPLKRMAINPLKGMETDLPKKMAINVIPDHLNVALVLQKELHDRQTQKSDPLRQIEKAPVLPKEDHHLLLSVHQDLYRLEEALVPLKEGHHHLKKGLNYTLLTFLLTRLRKN